MSSVMSTSSCGSDGIGRPKSSSPPGSMSESSSVGSASNGSPVNQRLSGFLDGPTAGQGLMATLGAHSRQQPGGNLFTHPPPPLRQQGMLPEHSTVPSRRGLSGGGLEASSGIEGGPATWNHTELVHALMQNNDVLIAWLKEMNLLAKSWSCPKCTSSMSWESISLTSWKTVDRYQWKCPRRSCVMTVHARSSSFFDRPFFVTLASFIEIIYWWAKGAPMAFVVEETGCGMEFLVYAYCLIREVCGTMVNEFVVGGPGAVTGWTDSLKLTINGTECETYLGSMQGAERKWRHKFGLHPFKNILEHIGRVYDVGSQSQNNRDWKTFNNFPTRGHGTDQRRDNFRVNEGGILSPVGNPSRPRGLYGSKGDASSAWKVEAPSLWQSSDNQEQHFRSRRS